MACLRAARSTPCGLHSSPPGLFKDARMDPTLVPAETALEMITIEGAKAVLAGRFASAPSRKESARTSRSTTPAVPSGRRAMMWCARSSIPWTEEACEPWWWTGWSSMTTDTPPVSTNATSSMPQGRREQGSRAGSAPGPESEVAAAGNGRGRCSPGRMGAALSDRHKGVETSAREVRGGASSTGAPDLHAGCTPDLWRLPGSPKAENEGSHKWAVRPLRACLLPDSSR